MTVKSKHSEQVEREVRTRTKETLVFVLSTLSQEQWESLVRSAPKVSIREKLFKEWVKAELFRHGQSSPHLERIIRLYSALTNG